MLIGLSIVLYIVGLNLNATFWPGLDPTGESKGILRAGGAVIEFGQLRCSVGDRPRERASSSAIAACAVHERQRTTTER